MRFELLPCLLEDTIVHKGSLQLMNYYVIELLPKNPREFLSRESETHPRASELCLLRRFVPGRTIVGCLANFVRSESLGIVFKDFIGDKEVSVRSREKCV